MQQEQQTLVVSNTPTPTDARHPFRIAHLHANRGCPLQSAGQARPDDVQRAVM